MDSRGSDAAKINGRKRHIAVNAIGLLLTVLKLTVEIVRHPDDLHTFRS